MLQDLADWGGCELNDFKKQYGDGAYLRVKRRDLADVIDTPFGRIMYLTREGRLAVGLTNLYHPTVQALVNNVAVRRSVALLLLEGYLNPEPRVYGNAHARMTDPEGKVVCVSARATTFSSQAIRLLATRLFDGTRPELTRLIVFVPKPKRGLKTFLERYPVEIRDVPLRPLVTRVEPKSRARGERATS